MRGNRTRESAQSEVNMTPMLDVVFIMLIFFIVTASFVKEAQPTAIDEHPLTQKAVDPWIGPESVITQSFE